MPEDVKTILGLIASPRKLGNCEIIVKEIARNVPEPHELKMIRLQSKNIRPCQACYACLENGDCPLVDDFRYIADHLAAADGVILASPCYLMGLNGVLKLFIDRGMQMFSRAGALLDKPAINIVTAGLEGEAGYTELALNSFTMILGLKLQESAVFYGALPGEALWKKEDEQQRARSLGRRLFDPAPRVTESWRCPLCGSDTVQLVGGRRVQCQVCRNYGAIELHNGGAILKMSLKPENILYTAEQRQHHRDWLRKEKKLFFRTYREISGFLRQYDHEGEWL
jgi:multimeric flavodoxin WrbA